MIDKIHSLFSIPVGEVILPTKFSSIVNFLDNQPLEEADNISDFGHKSADTYILDNPECKSFKNFLLEKISNYGQEILNLDYSEFKLSQSWVSVKNPGQTHVPHIHANSIISGVFYYGEFLDSTSELSFQIIPVNTSYVMYPKYKNNFNPLQGPYTLPVSPGILYLFPSYLGHAVKTNTTSIPRKSLAFNAVPKKGLGLRKSLTELKF